MRGAVRRATQRREDAQRLSLHPSRPFQGTFPAALVYAVGPRRTRPSQVRSFFILRMRDDDDGGGGSSSDSSDNIPLLEENLISNAARGG